MALIAVSGHPGCRYEEVARITAQRLGFELLTQSRIRALADEEFGAEYQDPRQGLPQPGHFHPGAPGHRASHGVLRRRAAKCRRRHFPGMLRVHVVAPENVRIGNLMLDRRLERAAARQLLLELEAADRADRKAKFGKTKATAELFDLVLQCRIAHHRADGRIDRDRRASSGGCAERGFLSPAAEAQLQFQMRMRLARYRHRAARQDDAAQEDVRPPERRDVRQPAGFLPHRLGVRAAQLSRAAWTRTATSLEAFTPDFYLPEFDLYVELTTMKQSLVTRKNRKVRLLRELYPHVNIQVFYQKDFENLIFKYGLAGRPVEA